VELPTERDYAQVMTDPTFGTLTREIRRLLGSVESPAAGSETAEAGSSATAEGH
jgi:hypothetical protein